MSKRLGWVGLAGIIWVLISNGESSCNFGDGTDQRVHSLIFMMMMMMMMMMISSWNIGYADQ